MAVNGVNTVKQRDFQARLQGPRLIFVHHFQPGGGVVFRRFGIAAAEHGAQGVLLNVGGVRDRPGIRLRHLADFLVERHARKQVPDTRINRQMGIEIGRDFRGAGTVEVKGKSHDRKKIQEKQGPEREFPCHCQNWLCRSLIKRYFVGLPLYFTQRTVSAGMGIPPLELKYRSDGFAVNGFHAVLSTGREIFPAPLMARNQMRKV